MITRSDWDKLTPQQQYHYVHLLEETVDSYADGDEEETVEVETKVYPAQAEPIPHEPLPEKFNVLGDDSFRMLLINKSRDPVLLDATSPHYRSQFLPRPDGWQD